MNDADLSKALNCAVDAAKAAGALMRRNFNATKKINSQSRHDIKLELDVRCQKLIQSKLLKSFPHIAVLGEEGVCGPSSSARRWVVDPIDGTVNFAHDIPHACVSIALQQADSKGAFSTIVGVIFDPFCNELWTAIRGQPARLNGKRISVSSRANLGEAIISLGFSKGRITLQENTAIFVRMIGRVRKIRMMGSAALELAYVASGRFDAYIEGGLRLWDLAAGSLIIEAAGGKFWSQPVPRTDRYRIIAENGKLRSKLERLMGVGPKATKA